MLRNPKVPNFAIVAFPSKEVIDFIKRLKEKYSSKKYSSSLSFPIKLYDFPHLTIKRKFLLNSGISEMQLIKIINSIVKNFSPPKLATRKIKLFKKLNENTVYLEIKNNANLLSSINEIQEVLRPITTTFEPKLETNFIPHLSILWQISDSRFAAVERIFEENVPTFKFEIDKLYLLKSFGTSGKRKPINIFKLKT